MAYTMSAVNALNSFFAEPMRPPVQNTFVHYPQSKHNRERSRSLPAKFVWEKPAPKVIPRIRAHGETGLEDKDEIICRRGHRWKHPHRATRKLLNELTTDELIMIAHDYGLGKLGCSDDRKYARHLLPHRPLGPNVPGRPRTPSGKYLDDVSWDNLILMLRELTCKRIPYSPADFTISDTPPVESLNNAAAYVTWVCDTLLQSQLRDVGSQDLSLFGGSSVMAWRMMRLCAMYGVSELWDEVLRRLGRGDLLLLTARPAPLLNDEIRFIKRAIGRCHILPITCDKLELERLAFHCDVLYLTGLNDEALRCLLELRTLRAPLAVLNICNSQWLAEHFLATGVDHAVFWPASVHDRVAVAFGTSFMSQLFEFDIFSAFEKARMAVSKVDVQPQLISRPVPTGEGNHLVTKSNPDISEYGETEADVSHTQDLHESSTLIIGSPQDRIHTYGDPTVAPQNVDTQLDSDTDEEDWLRELCWGHRQTT